jgi:hypothetical protein
MTLPSLTLVGTFTDVTGKPLTGGQLTVTPDAELIDASGATVLPAFPIVVPVNNGTFSVKLLPTDTAGVTPTGWAYQVTEMFPYQVDTRRGTATTTYYIQPTGTGTVNLADLPRMTTAPSLVAYGSLAGNNTWTGTNAFQGEVTVPAPVNPTDPATKAYVDDEVGVNAAAIVAETTRAEAAEAQLFPLSGGTVTGSLTVNQNLTVLANALGVPLPSASGYTAWSFDPAAISVNSNLTLGTVFLAAVYVSAAITVTKIRYVNNSAQGTLTSGACWAGLYNGSGSLLGQADISANTAQGFQSAVIGSVPVTPGMYWCALLANTSAGVFGTGAAIASANVKAAMNGSSSAAQFRFATLVSTGVTTLPSTFTPSANVASALPFWCAIQ